MIDVEALKANLQTQIEHELELIKKSNSNDNMRYCMGRHDAMNEILEALKSC